MQKIMNIRYQIYVVKSILNDLFKVPKNGQCKQVIY